MSDMHTPGVPGQVTDPSIATPSAPSNDVAELLRVMEMNTKAITRLTAVVTKLSGRSNVIERRLTALEGDGNTDKVSDDEPTPTR